MNRANCFARTLFLLLAVGSAWAQRSSNVPVTGSGTPGQIPVWLDSKTLGNSSISNSSGGGITVLNTATSGSGVAGIASAAGGNTLGVYGRSDSTDGAGVLGHAAATAGVANGVYGQTASPSGYGVEGFAPNVAVYGVSTGSTGSGVLGFGQAASGTNYGVQGFTNSTGGIGVYGHAAATSGFTTGVVGLVSSFTGTAGVFGNAAGGNILMGQVGGVNVFRVDGTGRGFFNGGMLTSGADFAESMAVAGSRRDYEPGDVLVINADAHRQLALAERPYSTLVAGIYSTKPGVLATPHPMADAGLAQEIPLAIVGIVPCKVSAENGPIEAGDLLVTSSTRGHAMKGTNRERMLGTVLGKALEPFSEGKGAIQVLVTLQ